MKRYCFDIDGTICTNTWGDYERAVPNYQRINFVNSLYDAGNHVIYFTARGMGTYHDNATQADARWRELTELQLRIWNCKYHELIMGKPSADYYIDDKAVNSNDFFN